MFSQSDFAVSHRVKFGERVGMVMDFNVLNVFNRASVLGQVDNTAALEYHLLPPWACLLRSMMSRKHLITF